MPAATTTGQAVDHDENARKAIRNLLAGNAPNGIVPGDCGAWSQIVADLNTAYASGGTIEVKQLFAILCRGDQSLMALMASVSSTAKTPQPDPSVCPELPKAAQAVYQTPGSCAAWLDEYIAHATLASPMTPTCFHEAAGLHTASVVIARRAVLRFGSAAIFPNIYVLFVGPSTVNRKTTGLKVQSNLLAHAGLSHLFLPHRMTPEALIQELGTSIPASLSGADPITHQRWLDSRAFAAQRGWVLDEAARLFDSLKRDYNNGLLSMLLDLFECPAEHVDRTVSRGYTIVRDAYLSFFGATTPVSLAPHLSNDLHWHDGLWARFALITPPAGKTPWQFFNDQLPTPQPLVDGLKRLYNLFPIPQAALITDPSDPDQKRKIVEVTGASTPTSVELGIDVKAAWEAYSKATGYDLLESKKVHETLFACYGRLGTQAIKVAMLLAAMDGATLPIRIELVHFARAQQIVESWRASLHRIWAKGATIQEAQDSDTVLTLLADAGPTGLATREIYRPLNLKAAEAQAQLEELLRAGLVEKVSTIAANGRTVEKWILIP